MFALYLSVVAMPVNTSGDAWGPLREGLDAWSALDFECPFGVSAGDAKGRTFAWESEGFSLEKTRLQGASLSKWPAAIMISGLVADGILSYDDKASKHLDFWTTSPLDSRSKVTLRHLLSFTSGFTEDPLQLPCFKGYLDCAEKLYKAAKKHEEPGKTWAYISIHLQLAGAMAVAASGTDIQSLFEKYLYRPFNMTKTDWSPHKVPQMATGITTTGVDFENLLQRLVAYEALPKAVQTQMEIDYSQPPVRPSGDGWFGHYGMGHWWECLGYGTPNERAPLPQACLDAHIQAGPGAYGFYPLIDRSGGGKRAGPSRPPMWFSVALQEPNPTSGIPEYLRLVAKPVADLIIGGHDPEAAPRAGLLEQGGGLIARDLKYIEGELGSCKCSRMPGVKGEPFKSLSKALPQDEPQVNRREIAGKGVGLLLRDIVAIQKELGHCSCEGRKSAAVEVV